MTRKHFEAVARAMAFNRPHDTTGEAYVQWMLSCASLASEFEAINPRFDATRFLAACDA
jgi:hypothetical protein